MADMIDLVQEIDPPVIRDGEAGQAFMGVMAATANYVQEAFRFASRAYNLTDGVGPALDALDPIAAEQGQVNYPTETTENRITRLSNVWTSAPLRGEESQLITELALAGYPGASIQYSFTRPSQLGPRDEPAPWWSQFWVVFENHVFTIDLGPVIGEDLVIGDSWVIPGPNEHVNVITRIIQKYSPGHWVCRRVEFSTGASVIGNSLVIGNSWVIGGTLKFFAIVG